MLLDTDPGKQYTRKILNEQHAAASDQGVQGNFEQCDLDNWPKGPYTQQTEGVLPPLLTKED